MSQQMFLKLKRLFSPNLQQNEEIDINQIFKPFYITLTIFGLLPYSITYNKSRDRFGNIPNSIYINTLCAFCYTAVMTNLCAVHIENLFNPDDAVLADDDVLITQLNNLLEIGSLVVFCMIYYINAFLNRFKFLKILNSFCALWPEPKTNSQNETLGRLRFQVNVMAMGSVMAVTILHCCVNFTRKEGLWKKILVLFTGILPSIIQTTILAFHFILVMMVVAILTDINQQLLKMTKQRKNTEEFYLEVDMRRMKLSLRRLEEVYTKAFEIKCEINELFQAPLLMSTLQCFHCIISESYAVYHGVMEHITTLHSVINCLVWIAIQLFKVYSLSYSGNVLRNEAMKIGQSLHAISTDKQDLKLFMEIQHFSTLMNYQGFMLTVYGYFSLNASLMSAMISNVTMYLIILIQFDKSNGTTSEHNRIAM